MNFIVKTNYDKPYINYAICIANGKEFVLDRKTTWYSYDSESQTMDMEWDDLYIWDGEKEIFDFPERYLFVRLDIEDDAPNDYFCLVESVIL